MRLSDASPKLSIKPLLSILATIRAVVDCATWSIFSHSFKDICLLAE